MGKYFATARYYSVLSRTEGNFYFIRRSWEWRTWSLSQISYTFLNLIILENIKKIIKQHIKWRYYNSRFSLLLSIILSKRSHLLDLIPLIFYFLRQYQTHLSNFYAQSLLLIPHISWVYYQVKKKFSTIRAVMVNSFKVNYVNINWHIVNRIRLTLFKFNYMYLVILFIGRITFVNIYV